MKKTITTLGILSAMAMSTHASILFTEDFSYADGSLSSTAAWDTHSGTAGQIQVSGGVITVTDSQTEDVNRLFGSTITSGSVYAAFDFSVTSSSAGGTDFEYFAHFGTGTSNFNSRMEISAANASGDYTVGVSHASSTDATWASDLTFGTTYKAVLGYDRDTGTATLWLDPANIGSTSIATSTTNSTDVTTFYLRESGSSINETTSIDNLFVGTAFTDVVPVPEPSSTALLGLGGLALIMRRRK